MSSRVLYFDVPEHLRSRAPALVYTMPKVAKPMPAPSDIVCAVRELLIGESQRCSIAEEVTSW